jgi:hypothetical protein
MTARKRTPLLVVLLAAISVLFVAILVFTYVAADRAHPVILDEKGIPR